MTIDDIALICHELNRAYCLALGDRSQPAWKDAPDWQRESAVSGVEFHRANPDADDAASHNNWLQDKAADGWTYGPMKDAAKKEHHCMVPFERLPLDQQIKDKLFRQTVHAVLPLLEE
jgi:hypothetical protein